MFVTPAEMVTLVSESQDEKASPPMLCTESGKVTDPMESQLAKAYASILVTLAGIVTPVSAHARNAALLMLITPTGMVTDLREPQ